MMTRSSCASFLLSFAIVSLCLAATSSHAQQPWFGQADSTDPAVLTANRNAGFMQATTQPVPAPVPAAPLPPREVDESVFGATLFLGHFAAQAFRGFNPDYLIGVGDRIDLKLWGAFDLVSQLSVDSQGNIFIPKVGPIRVLNVRNAELNNIVSRHIGQVFRENVGVYASLAAAEPVKVYVAGHVREPGLYGAYASDSLLHFLDRAGGIDTESGGFLEIRLLRGQRELKVINLYDFLLNGTLPLVQFQDGDTLMVGAKQDTVKVSGLVNRPLQFEFRDRISLARLLEYAGVDGLATHVRLVRNQAEKRSTDYLPLQADLESIQVLGGDEVSVFADRRIGSIITTVEGEFEGLSQHSLPYESNLAQLLEKVQLTSRSNLEGVQLYRESIAKRQKEVLHQMLQKLEQSVLTARSGTREEAQLRAQEAELVLKFIDRARNVKPNGRLVLHQGFDPAAIDLEDRDVLTIPRQSNTVAVQGEVYFPSSFIHQAGKSVAYYLDQAGGLTQYGERDRIFVIRPSGEMEEARDGFFRSTQVRPGDEIMVLPQVDSKKFQFSKDLVQIIYQLALSAGVVLRL